MRFIRGFGLFLAGCLLAGLGARTAVSQGITFDQAPLTIFTENGRHDFIVDVAGNILSDGTGLALSP